MEEPNTSTKAIKMDIRYSTITKSALKDFVNSDVYQTLQILPISPHRAASYSAHPRAEEDDAVLFLAWDKSKPNTLLGYLGIFPDYFYLKDQQWKVGWLSCLLVDPICRGQGVAKEFMRMAFEAWKGNIAVTGFTPAALGLYNKTELFDSLYQSTGLRAYLRADSASILVRKKPVLTKLKPILKIADSSFNTLYDLRLSNWLKTKQTKFADDTEVNYPTVLNEQHKAIIEKWNKENKFALEKRTSIDIQWILDFPWILQGESDSISERYHFSAVADEFKQGLLEIQRKSGAKAQLRSTQPTSLVLYTIKNGVLKIPGAWFVKEEASTVTQTIITEMIKHKCHTLVLFNHELIGALKAGPHPFIHLREAVRKYILAKTVRKELKESNPNSLPLVLQDGEGDAAFT